MADLFARNGIAALAYDKRGSGDSTGSYRTIGADFRSLAEDVVAGVGHLRGRGDIDPGASASGGAVAWRETWPGRARLGHGAVVATAVAYLPLLAYWRLLG
jgi:alpha-beta hydrolase superfamily lysophospholipase